MEIKIAPCGLVCSRCDAYRATQENSPEKLELVAADWRRLYQCDDIKAEFISCDGCMTENGRKCYHCEHQCEIRKCAVEKKVAVCSECEQYPCKMLSGFLEYVPQAQANPMRKMLDAIAEVEKNMHSAF
ncbi:MAG: DUF3795 domain-containing protein [Victivallaceae bacterium]|nr:DUF3795 domain-containing protein [Victivallaceae bacterium]